jgi:hypothetical protein
LAHRQRQGVENLSQGHAQMWWLTETGQNRLSTPRTTDGGRKAKTVRHSLNAHLQLKNHLLLSAEAKT